MNIITQRQNNNGPKLKWRKRIRSLIHLCVNSSYFCLVRYVNQETGSGRERELKGIMYKLLFACKQSLNNFPPFKWHYNFTKNWGDPSFIHYISKQYISTASLFEGPQNITLLGC